MGRARKQPTKVIVTCEELKLVVTKLGYATRQDLLDDLAMGKISQIGASVDLPKATPSEKGSGKVIEVAQPTFDKGNGGKRLSWADIVEEEICKSKEIPSKGGGACSSQNIESGIPAKEKKNLTKIH